MASISSLMGSSSSTSSIYGSRNTNIISGLASGMDTEAMIEGMVQGYQQKITQLQQSKTKLQWQQEAYQSISDKLVEFSRKYTSYAYSTTNLMSNTFFNNAVITSTKGQYADLITASGKSSSSVVINSVKQLATNATYTVSNKLGAQEADGKITVSGGKVNLGDETTLSAMDGRLTIAYGTQSVSLSFGEFDLFADASGNLDTGKLQDAINEQLDSAEIVINGTTYKASDCISATVSDDGTITLKDKKDGGNNVYIKGASGNLANFVNDLDDVVENESGTFSLKTTGVTEKVNTGDYLADKTISVTLNDQTKQIKLDGIVPGQGESFQDAFVRTLNEKLEDAFGSGKITADLTAEGGLSFTASSTDTFSVSSTVSSLVLGIDGGLTSYLDTSKSLGSLLGENENGELNGLTPLKAVGSFADGYDSAGNRVDENGNRVDSDGKLLYGLTINGVEIGQYTKDTAIETIINNINGNSEAGVNVSYSKLTNQFVFTARDSGSAGKIEMGDGLAKTLFGDSSGYTPGKDAVFTATINGKTMEMTRSSNTVDIDGLTVTMEGTFDAKDKNGNVATSPDDIDPTQGVSFSSKTDADTIIDTIKQMVTDYNAMVTEIKKAYSDMPLKQTNGSRYEPLTADDEADMTDSEIAAYEEKAKTGILFMDNDLSSLYMDLRSVVTSGGNDGAYLRSIGIETSYGDGLTTITLDESKLRTALETDLEGVRDAFTKTTSNGAQTDGLMASIQKITDKYAATTGAVKGILIEKAGSQYSPTASLDNTMLDKMSELDDQIAKWQSKMSDKVDYYTNKFTQLELLINQMNSQSSALAGLTGGY